MILVALRGLFTRKLRTILTMIAIVLGVSMIAGTYILSDTINSSFAAIFHNATRNYDAVVSGKQPVTSRFSPPPTLSPALLRIVQSTPGVAAAEGEVAAEAQLFTTKGKQIGGIAGPALLFSRPTIDRFKTLTIVRGHEPHGRELALDEGTVTNHHLRLGQTIEVAAQGPVERFTLVGVLHFAGVSSLGGASLISMDVATAQRIAGKHGRFDQIVVAASPGVSAAEIVARIRARVPIAERSVVQVKTAQQHAQDETNAIGNALSFLTIALLAFGGIAVFVGAFIIFNTFSITVAQRTREFAMLRTIGAVRGQILRAVILEALVIGVVASLIGLFAGIGIAQGLNALFKAIGADLPNQGQVIATRTIVVSLLVGTIVTLLAGGIPAFRATQVSPIAALHEGAQLPRSRWARYVPALASVVAIIGIVLIAYGVFGSISSGGQRLSLLGAGGVAVLLGVAMLAPKLVPPLASVIGWPMERSTAITGRLARENAVRNPSRTAVTAAALMIGLALVGFVTVFAAELRQSANDAINREVAGDFVVSASGNSLIPGSVQSVLNGIPGVRTTSAFKEDAASAAGIGHVHVNGIQSKTIASVYRFQWKQGGNGTLAAMGTHGALIDDTFASDHHLGVGSLLHLTTPIGTHDTFHVVGIYKSSQLLPTLCIPYATLGRDWQQSMVASVVISATPGANLTTVQHRIDRVLLRTFPLATAQSQQDIKNQTSSSINRLLTLIYVLLAMSVLISFFGIVNTLVLSVYERTREIGMLRAVGTTRRQVGWIVRWESVITAVLGAILGLVLGVAFAYLITAGLESQGIEYALPVGQLVIWVVFAVLFGLVAAAFPARRAARLDVLQAISYE